MYSQRAQRYQDKEPNWLRCNYVYGSHAEEEQDCANIYIYIYIYIHTHTHTHTHRMSHLTLRPQIILLF
jgi:hypothetical protein